MAGMQRFVTYIYAYDDGRKSSNAGYAKIETRGNAGRMEIHFTGASVIRGVGKVCFLQGKNGKFIYFPAGEFPIENGAGAFQTAFLTGDVLKSGLEFEQIDGIEIRDSHDRMYLSFWKDVKLAEFTPELFVPAAEAEVATKVEAEMATPEVAGMPEEKVPAENGLSEPEEPQKQTLEEAEQEMLHTMEVPVRNVFPQINLEDIWQNLQKNRLSVQINENVSAVQIELKDLRELPKRYWYLGNNSFLLHGFFNYHYLLLGKLVDGSWFLGVPGVYQKQERVMASIFGFPGFLSAGEGAGEMASTPGQSLQTAEVSIRELQPGAWYHILED